ncbi:hypothetical protein [Hydrogenimonas cancrithermarum]|uniref:Uncharacterized protein n=1 Tax=Hydrogenimonas cancrithermarum TaxID=2993563 RepID=A0ABM8FNF0_9BACT|nr:hypothetical protein [Hydrogenimonas cancrithermarum]BDY13874.1 hypothetical protein HCR_21860 [Hydrogenimonas cancrithermarum]
MYHYLKWAALSLFFKRNIRYLIFLLIGLIGIYVADAVYQDMVEFSVVSKETGNIGKYLLMKWIAVLFFSGMVVWSIFKFGFGRKSASKEKRSNEAVLENDPYMKRLKKFKTPKKLRSKSDLLIEKKRKNRDWHFRA